MTKLSDAIAIRDAVLGHIEAHGRPLPMIPGVPVKCLHIGPCSLVLTGPFRSKVGAPLPLPASAADAGPLLLELDIWWRGKVFHLEWEVEGTEATVGHFKRGEWEACLPVATAA